ncbi:Cof-type HAD-IIB family hydrolase [Ammoniphilus sp. CFH 90114]|uniref:Cof-type HAD-IIB family hydrolase n=1 Tax=Ammoniphilus sp. CFH 90114 TaxID=2493665 RepID=UPI0013E9701D|nr:Cof-type HAD-IIB family hydrolase [Ammoniphilus sp. CFH 90114]
MKLIALDMDGTLLNHHQTVSPANVEAVRLAQSRGVEVVIATGRSYREALPLIKEAGLHCPMLCVNGADIRTAEGKRVAHFPIALDLYQQVASILKNTQLYYEVYTDEGTLTEDREKAMDIVLDYYKGTSLENNVDHLHSLAQQRFTTGSVHLVESFSHYLTQHEAPVFKVMGYSIDPSRLAKARHLLSAVSGLAVSASAPINLEVNSELAQKGNAVQTYAESLGITLKDVMAIGDSFNDLSMLRIVGMPVAMGNAAEEVKAVCQFTTKTNEEDGVAFAIKRILG